MLIIPGPPRALSDSTVAPAPSVTALTTLLKPPGLQAWTFPLQEAMSFPTSRDPSSVANFTEAVTTHIDLHVEVRAQGRVDAD